jgi:hypothetical protein
MDQSLQQNKPGAQSARRNHLPRVFVGNLNGAVSESALYELFSGYCGTISAAKNVFTVGGLRTIAAMGGCSFHPASLAQLVFTCCLFVTYFDLNSLAGGR